MKPIVSSSGMESSPPSSPHHTKHHIFLSHSGHQKGFAKDLYEKLTSLSYSVFFDQDHHSLPPGQPFPPLIFSAANTCKLAIVVLSHDFLSSRWPMLELCAFADRLSSQSEAVTLLPLFFKLSPEDVKREENLDRWREAWEGFQQRDGRINASQCERVVTKLLPRLNGIVHQSEAEQGEASYVKVVVDATSAIIPTPGCFTIRNKKYSGRDRLCKVILDKFQDLEDTRSSSAAVFILGMYGIPGSGKSTLCTFVCDSMFGQLSGNVFYLDLPRDSYSDAEKMSRITQQCFEILSKFNPYAKDIVSMDLNKVLHLLSHATSIEKILLVVDNITASNYEIYTSILQALLSSAVLGPGSRIMLVAHSLATLEDLQSFMEGEGYSRYRYATMEVPRLTEEEAIEVIRNRCPSMKEELATHLRSKINFPTSSSIYIPFVLEQIGVFLGTKICREVEELENLWKMVDYKKTNAVQELVGMNLLLLQEDLKDLFLDIALYIIPAGYSDLEDATPILSTMHRICDTIILRVKITDLEKHCALSVIQNQLRLHDIFTEYASSIGNSASYVFQPSPDVSGDHATDQYLKFVEARCICIGTCTESPRDPHAKLADDDDDHEVRLHVEIGPNAQVLLVRNRRPYSMSTLDLSGDLSSLVCFRAEGMQQIALSPFGNGTSLSNLVRLELRCSGQNMNWRGRSFLDFMSHILRYCTQSMMTWPFKLPCSQEHVNDFISSGRMPGLRFLILENFPGIPRLEIGGQNCPELESLIVSNLEDEEMDVRIERAPKLKRLVTGNSCHFAVPSILRNKRMAKKSRKLALDLGECGELREMYVDGSFDQVKVDGLLPSKLQRLTMGNDRCPEFLPWKLVSSSAHHLSKLEKLGLIRTKVTGGLHFTKEHLVCLPSLEELYLECCSGLRHLSMDPGCVPNLVRLHISHCEELLDLEGVEDMLMQKLRGFRLEHLPQLQWECDVMCEASTSCLQLERVIVDDCQQVRMDLNVLQASKNLRSLRLGGGGVVLVEKKKPDARMVQHRWTFSEWQFTLLKTVEINGLDDLREIEGIQHLRSLVYLSLSYLPNLTRISGAWPSNISSIYFRRCPMLLEVPPLPPPDLDDLQPSKCVRLKAVEGCFLRTKGLRFVEFLDCESMETFSLLREEWRKNSEGYASSSRAFSGVGVCGSGFASVEVMQAWLQRDAQMGSRLWEAAVVALIWEHVEKSTLGALQTLHDYFSALVGVANKDDLLYLRRSFFPSTFYFLRRLASPDQVKLFEEWLPHKFPQLSIQQR